jgi:hypothetical protein
VQAESFNPLNRSFARRFLFRHCLFLYRRHFNEVTHALDLTAKRRRILHHDFMLVMLETHRFQCLPHPPCISNSAANLLDPYLSRSQYRLLGFLRTSRVPPDVSSSQVAPPESSPVTCSRASSPQRRALARFLQLWSAASTHREQRAPCCADSSSQDSS